MNSMIFRREYFENYLFSSIVQLISSLLFYTEWLIYLFFDYLDIFLEYGWNKKIYVVSFGD